LSKSQGRRLRVALVSLAAVALAVSAASPALADGGTPLTPTKLVTDNVACATDQNAAPYENANGGLDIAGAPEDSDLTGIVRETPRRRRRPRSPRPTTRLVSQMSRALRST
jgi:hypothetical protein